MATKTVNYNLVKPLGKEKVDIDVINANMDAIDTAMKGLDNNKLYLANNLTTAEEGYVLDAVQGKVLADRVSEVNSALSQVSSIKTAGGTATAITFTNGTLFNGYATSFIASANNNGSDTTINGIPLYKPNTTTAPTLIAGKAYTVWYNSTTPCFFIKASAEGTAVAGDVLAGIIFSNDNCTGITGTMANIGAVNKTLTSGQVYTIPSGFHNGAGMISAPLVPIGAGTFNMYATSVSATKDGVQSTTMHLVTSSATQNPPNVNTLYFSYNTPINLYNAWKLEISGLSQFEEPTYEVVASNMIKYTVIWRTGNADLHYDYPITDKLRLYCSYFIY